MCCPTSRRPNGSARVAENNLTIAWVQSSLAQRCAGYRYTLNRLAIAEPVYLASNVDVSLTLLQQQIADNRLVPVTQFAAAPPVVAPPPPIVK